MAKGNWRTTCQSPGVSVSSTRATTSAGGTGASSRPTTSVQRGSVTPVAWPVASGCTLHPGFGSLDPHLLLQSHCSSWMLVTQETEPGLSYNRAWL